MVKPSPRPPSVAAGDFHRRRRGRNMALALTLAGLVVLFFVVSLVKMTTLERRHVDAATPAAGR